MKFKKLEIHNIASIEDAVIDFESQPLAGSEVFLITGKTGAGKSTILDAICLALYNNTPRLADSSKTTGKVKDLMNDENGKVFIGSTSQMLRRNKVEGHVCLTFNGSDGNDYEARWNIHRAGKKLDGNFKTERTLKRLDTEDEYRNTDMQTLVLKQAVGLTFEQFCRTTMLAQGEFTKFLKSNEDDKSAILEKITGAGIYTLIGAKIEQIYKEKKTAYTALKEKTEEQQVLTDEQVAEKVAEQNAYDTEVKVQNAKKADLSEKSDWLKKEAEFNKKEQDTLAQLAKAQELVASNEMKQASELVKQWNDTIEARGWLKQQQEAEGKARETEVSLKTMSEEFASLRGGYAAEQKWADDMKAKLKLITEQLEAQADKATVFDKHLQIEAWLQNIIDGQREIAKQQKAEQKLRQQLNGDLARQKAAATEQHMRQKDLVDKCETGIKKKQEELSLMNLPQQNKSHSELVKREQQLKSASDRLTTLHNAKKKHEEDAANLAKSAVGITELTQKVKTLEGQMHDAEILMNERQRVYEVTVAKTENWATDLRAKLKPGDVCPVCFQKITSAIQQDGPVNALYEETKKNYEEAKATFEAVKKQYNKANTELNAQQKTYQAQKNALDNDHSVDDAERLLKEALALVAIDDDNAADAVAEQAIANKEKLAAIEKNISRGNELQTSLDNARKNLETQQRLLDKAKLAMDKADKTEQECKSNIAMAVKLKENHLSACKEKEQSVENALGDSDAWAADWKATPQSFKDSLQEAAIAYGEQKEQKASLANTIANADELLKRVDGVLGNILVMCHGWSALPYEAASRMPNLETTVNALAQNVTQRMTSLKQYQETAKASAERVARFREKNAHYSADRLTALAAYSKAAIDEKAMMVKRAEDNLKQQQTLAETIKKDKAEHQHNRPSLQEGDTIEAINEQIIAINATTADLQQKIGAIKQQLDDDKKMKQELDSMLKDMETARAEQDRWEKLDKYFGDSTGKTFRNIAQSYVLAQLIHSANEYMKQLTDRYTLYINPGSFVVYMEDAYQNYVRRPASTLSGGESFLVSLALALALSDIDQKQSADILFIDEGFGTLSGDPLMNAINTLRTLHSTAGRRVGIISHIDELREKLSVQIHVDQNGNNSKGVVSVIG